MSGDNNHLLPGKMGDKVKSSASMTPAAHISVHNFICQSSLKQEKKPRIHKPKINVSNEILLGPKQINFAQVNSILTQGAAKLYQLAWCLVNSLSTHVCPQHTCAYLHRIDSFINANN